MPDISQASVPTHFSLLVFCPGTKRPHKSPLSLLRRGYASNFGQYPFFVWPDFGLNLSGTLQRVQRLWPCRFPGSINGSVTKSSRGDDAAKLRCMAPDGLLGVSPLGRPPAMGVGGGAARPVFTGWLWSRFSWRRVGARCCKDWLTATAVRTRSQ